MIIEISWKKIWALMLCAAVCMFYLNQFQQKKDLKYKCVCVFFCDKENCSHEQIKFKKSGHEVNFI